MPGLLGDWSGAGTHRVRLFDAPGQVAADMVTVTPPGIPVLMPGESIGASDGPLLRYLSALESFDRRFPGFGSETHGVTKLLGGNRLLLTPVCAEPAFEQDADITYPDRALRLFPAMWPMTAVPVLGFAAVTVPVHIDEGLPFSARLIGGRFEEDLVLDAAQAIEDRAGVPPLWT